MARQLYQSQAGDEEEVYWVSVAGAIYVSIGFVQYLYQSTGSVVHSINIDYSASSG
jgi:hypothetical protein